MKKVAVILLVLLISSNTIHASTFNEMKNGIWWNNPKAGKWNKTMKAAYLRGIVESSVLFRGIINAHEQSKEDPRLVTLPELPINMENIYSALEQFYSDYKNTQIPVIMAIRII